MSNNQYKLRLKIVWFKDFLGLAIDQVSLKREYSLTPYYFWPKTEAWEQLKLELDSKLWLGTDEKIEILKTTGEVMNYWLSQRNTKFTKNLKESFPEIEVLALNEIGL
jgi:30S ribosomal protein 3